MRRRIGGRRKKLRNAVVISEWFRDGVKDSDKWDCDYCRKKNLLEKRNCNGRFKPVPTKVFDKVFDRCPVSLATAKACEDFEIISMCESGFGGSYLASDLVEETQYFFNVRRIVNSERSKIERWKSKKEAKNK